MGLTIVREIITENYDGEIEVKSSTYEKANPGKGETTIQIKIPLKNLIRVEQK